MEPQERKRLTRLLEQVGRGDIPPASVPAIVREALDLSPSLATYVYQALSESTWRLLVSRSFDDELVDWHNAQRLVEAELADRGMRDVASQVVGLSDLIAKSYRFAEAQPDHAVMARKHVRATLEAVAAAGREIERSWLAKAVGLKDANLSRVLLVLTSNGLLKRRSAGREAFFELTAEGRRALSAQETREAESNKSVRLADWDDVPFPLACWSKIGTLEYGNSSFRGLLAHLGWKAERVPSSTEFGEQFRDFARPTYDDFGTDEVSVGDRTIAVRVHETHQGSIHAIGFDVSAYKSRQNELEKIVDALKVQVRELTKQISDLRHGLTVHMAASRSIRERVVEKMKAYRSILDRSAFSYEANDTVEMKAVNYLTRVVPSEIEHYFSPPMIEENLPMWKAELDPNKLVMDVVTSVSQLEDRFIAVQSNVLGKILGNPDALSNSLHLMALVCLGRLDNDHKADVRTKTVGDKLKVTIHGNLARSSYVQTDTTDTELAYCRDIATKLGGQVSWAVNDRREAIMEIEVPGITKTPRHRAPSRP